jgi:HD-GYP domain-containing protein (c-di-GMP phosphodiesterase class II)
MQILEVASLKLGAAFPEPLFHKTGRKLLAARTTLTQLHVDALLRSGITLVYEATSAAEVLEHVNARLNTVNVADLAVGMTAEADLMTPDGVVMIQLNEQVEEHHIAALRDSGIVYLFAKPPADVDEVRKSLEDMARVVTNRLEGLIRRGEYLQAPESRDPFLKEVGSGAGDVLNLNGVHLMRRRLSARLQPLYGMLETGRSPAHEPLEEIARDLMDLMKSEPRQFSQLAMMTPRKEDYLPDHAISVAVLSMAIAAHLQLAKDMITQVILGALLFDVGMLMVPKRIRQSSGTLTDADRQRVRAHPIYSVTMMEQIPGITPIPRLMGYQHHERLSGGGYPVGAPVANVSDFARIVAVADVFAASTNPRSYKSAKLPYNAMEELVIMAHKGLLDTRVVKALLSAIGLFPVGSFVALSNGDTAQVVGANAARIDRPVLRLMAGGEEGGPVMDLLDEKYGGYRIVKAIPTPTLAGEKQAV